MSDIVVRTPFKVGTKLTGLAALKAAELAKSGEQEEISASELPHRIGIVFDNSGSMYGVAIEDAKAGVEEFLRSCTKDQTAVALYPLHGSHYNLEKNLPAIAVLTKGISATGSTPLVFAASRMLKNNKLTRAIIFSDGEPDRTEHESLITGIPIDTVYIPAAGGVVPRAENFLKAIAEKTGGVYLRFERGKSNFRTAFKYLSPGLRHMLADKSFVEKLEGR